MTREEIEDPNVIYFLDDQGRRLGQLTGFNSAGWKVVRTVNTVGCGLTIDDLIKAVKPGYNLVGNNCMSAARKVVQDAKRAAKMRDEVVEILRKIIHGNDRSCVIS